MKVGIENLRVVVQELAETTQEIVQATADGKFTIFEVVGLSDNMLHLATQYSKRAAIVNEFKDLDSDEAKELAEIIGSEIHNVKDSVKKALELLVLYYQVYTQNRENLKQIIEKTRAFVQLVKK